LLFSNTEYEVAVKRPSTLLALLLLLAPAPALAEWHEASSAHFRVFADDDAESVRAFATRLERFDKGMRVLHSLPDLDRGPANRVTVYVVDDSVAVQRLIGGRAGVRGFYIPRASGSIAFTPRNPGNSSHAGADELDAQVILFHEYAHHFMYQNFVGPFPAWFVEGFAEFNSTARIGKDGGVRFGIPANHRAQELMNTRGSSVESLFSSFGQRGPAGLYGRGWLLTHFLRFERSRNGQFNAFLAALNAGQPSEQAARSAFGDFRKLDSELRSYAKQPRLPGVDIDPQALPIGPVSVRQVSPGEAAVMAFRMQSDRGVDTGQAKALVAGMREAAAPFPADPAVQAALAEAEFDAGNHDEAEAAADRALAVQPANIDALMYKARVSMAKARAGGAAAWKEARRRIAAANRIDPDAPEPLIRFYQSFLFEGVAPTANAVTGLLRAFELAPHDRGLRVIVGRQYLIDGKPAEARAALAPLAFDPHGGERAKAIQTVLAKLEEGGPAAALAAWSGIAAAREGGES
jgi:tetratricopeptide (TPR) repeat protein